MATAEDSSAVRTEVDSLRMDVQLKHETVWLSQRGMAEAFATTPENIVMHLRNVFSTQELDAEATTKDFLGVRTEGPRHLSRRIRHSNPDAVISVGYRAESRPAARGPQVVPIVPAAIQGACVSFAQRPMR